MRLYSILFGLLITSIVNTVSAVPIGGPLYSKGRVDAQETNEYSLLLDKGATVFTISGDGNGNIDCYAYDENGKEVNRDITGYDGCRLVVYPDHISKYRFVFTNSGDFSSTFYMRAK